MWRPPGGHRPRSTRTTTVARGPDFEAWVVMIGRGRFAAAMLAMLLGACSGGLDPETAVSAEPSPGETVLVDIAVDVDAASADTARQHGVELEVLLEDAVARAAAALPPRVDSVAVEARSDPSGAHIIAGYGVGGVSGPFGVRVLVDPDSLDLDAGLEQLPSLVAHEVHHVWRFNSGVSPHQGLLGVVVSEGLADHFAAETHPGIEPAAWTRALPPEEIDDWYERMVSAHEELLGELSSTAPTGPDPARPVIEAWLFGDEEIPRWTGYTLGYELVGDYLDRNDTTAAASFSTHWETIIDEAGPDWRRR